MKSKIIAIILAVISLLTFLFISYFAVTNKVNDFDQSIYTQVSKFINPTNTKLMKIITFLGSGIGILIGVGISFFFFKSNFDRLFLFCGMGGEVVINQVLKHIVQRPRPMVNQLVSETGYSFPSGHSMAATCFFLLIIFFLWKSAIPKQWKIIITIPFAIIIPLILLSRVYLGVHYSSDVIAAFFLSFAYVAFLVTIYGPIKNYFI